MAVYSWGLGKSGQLGNGAKETCEAPQLIKLPQAAIQAAAGGLFSAIVTQDGDVYAFGCGKYGRLGTGDKADHSKPIRVKGLSQIAQLSCGIWHGAAVDQSRQLWVWGYSQNHGVLGFTPATTPSPPCPVPALKGVAVAGVACGNNYTLVWTAEGVAYSWGCGRHGVLGHGDEMDRLLPTVIEALKGKTVVHMDAGFAHSGAVTADGDVYMFGQNKDGALGLGSTKPAVRTLPCQVQSLPGKVLKVSCSLGEHHGHTLALTEAGECYSWGDGYKGKLGVGDQASHFTPVLIPSSHVGGQAVSHVAAGGIHSTALTAEGGVFTWGCGSDGRLGHPEAKGHRYLFRSDTPRLVESLQDFGRGISLCASYYHTVAVVQKK